MDSMRTTVHAAMQGAARRRATGAGLPYTGSTDWGAPADIGHLTCPQHAPASADVDGGVIQPPRSMSATEPYDATEVFPSPENAVDRGSVHSFDPRVDAGSQGREGTESTEIAGPDLSGELRWRNGWIIPSRQLKAILDKIDLASERYWGPFLYRGCVSYLVAPTSSGKTVFLKRLARHLALGDPFLAFTPPKPLTVLYIELESPDLVLKEQFDVIEPVDGLDFVRCSGDALEAVLKRSAKDYDVVILDPLVVGFPVENENDNAEANRQLLLFTALKTQHGTAFILTHNVGVSEEAGARGRGASARKDRIDVEWMYTKIGTGRRLEITKDRAGHLGTALEVAFDGELDFALTKLHLPHTTKTGQMVSRVLDAPWSGPQSRAALMLLLGIQRDSADDKLLTRALTYAVKNSMLYQTNPRAPYTRTKEG